MKITQIVPIKEYDATAQNEEEYDKYICYLYEGNFSLANTFETHKAQLVDGLTFNYHNKSPASEVKISISHDYSKITIIRNVSCSSLI